MARIISVSTAYPQTVLTPERVRIELKNLLGQQESDLLTLLLGMVDTSGVKNRFMLHPPEHILTLRSLEQQCREFAKGSIELGSRVAKDALAKAGLTPQDIDFLITVSCTGFMIPSLDAYLINELGFRSNCRRLPITELGCAGGAAAIARAADFLAGDGKKNALIVAVELPTLTFQPKDLTLPALISALLFGDGAAAVVLQKDSTAPGAEILETSSHLFPNSTRAMGFDLKSTGFHIVLRKDVPDLIRSKLKELSSELLSRRSLSIPDLAFLVFHPGGRKILEYIAEELEVGTEALRASWSILERVGNLSSASVLAVYEEELVRRPPSEGEYGLMAAFGPGFSAEMLLLQWHEGDRA